jgi:hypothetical protein
VKDEIINFDAHKVTPEIRKGVEQLLKKCPDSFDEKVLWVALHCSLLVLSLSEVSVK